MLNPVGDRTQVEQNFMNLMDKAEERTSTTVLKIIGANSMRKISTTNEDNDFSRFHELILTAYPTSCQEYEGNSYWAWKHWSKEETQNYKLYLKDFYEFIQYFEKNPTELRFENFSLRQLFLLLACDGLREQRDQLNAALKAKILSQPKLIRSQHLGKEIPNIYLTPLRYELLKQHLDLTNEEFEQIKAHFFTLAGEEIEKLSEAKRNFEEKKKLNPHLKPAKIEVLNRNIVVDMSDYNKDFTLQGTCMNLEAINELGFFHIQLN